MNRRGFTLIETIITITILSFVSLVFVGMLMWVAIIRSESNDANKQIALMRALFFVSREIRKNPDNVDMWPELRADNTIRREDGMVMANDIVSFEHTISGDTAFIVIASERFSVETETYLRPTVLAPSSGP
jgi:prepilin-type N-terminal cleavage/methylation domain-containing protein